MFPLSVLSLIITQTQPLQSVQSRYDQSAQAVQTHRGAAGEEDAEESEDLRPASSVGHGRAQLGEGGAAGQVRVSLLPVVVVYHHPEHGEEHSQLEQHGVHQDAGRLSVQHSDDALKW